MADISWAQLAADAGDALNPIPIGEYNAKITKAEVKFAKSGSKMFAISAKVMDGPHVNRMFWNNFTVTPDNPNAMIIFFRHMAALGLNTQFFATNPTDDQVLERLRGVEFRARLGIRAYNGVDSNQLEALFPANAGVAAPAAGVGPVVGAGVPAQPQPQAQTGVPIPGVPADPAPTQPAATPLQQAAAAIVEPAPTPPVAVGPTVEELQAQLAAMQAAAAPQPAPAAEPQPAATTDWAADAAAQAQPAATPQPAQSIGQAAPF